MMTRYFDSMNWISVVESIKLFWTGGRTFEFHVRFEDLKMEKGTGRNWYFDLVYAFLSSTWCTFYAKMGEGGIPGYLIHWSYSWFQGCEFKPHIQCKAYFKKQKTKKQEWFRFAIRLVYKLYGNSCWFFLACVAPLVGTHNIEFWGQVWGINL